MFVCFSETINLLAISQSGASQNISFLLEIAVVCEQATHVRSRVLRLQDSYFTTALASYVSQLGSSRVEAEEIRFAGRVFELELLLLHDAHLRSDARGGGYVLYDTILTTEVPGLPGEPSSPGSPWGRGEGGGGSIISYMKNV